LTNGICERFHKTVLNEFYRVAFRKKVYRSIDELQADLDAWVREYNEVRPHQGRWCFGKTPMQNIPGCHADRKGEDDRCLTTLNVKTDFWRMCNNDAKDSICPKPTSVNLCSIVRRR